MKLASTFSRPRWVMPMTTSFMPSWLPRLRICSSAGISDFAAVEAEALGARIFAVEEPLEQLGGGQPLQDRPLPTSVKRVWLRLTSMRSWIQAFWAGSWMCMNSTPMLPQ